MLGRALQENEDLRRKHGEALKKIDSHLKTVAEKDEEIARLRSQSSSEELGGDQLESDGYREKVEAILEGLQDSIPGETSLAKLSSLVQQHENSAALEQSLLDLRADFERLRSTHSVPAPEVARLHEENSRLKEENNQLKMRLTQTSNEVDQLQQEVQEKEESKLQMSNEVCTQITNHFAL